MSANSTWTALRNPVFRNMWLASLISGTCVAAQDTAATWTMNRVSDSPLFLSLMSTVASLPFFFFTLPGRCARRHGRPQTNDACHDHMAGDRGRRTGYFRIVSIWLIPGSF